MWWGIDRLVMAADTSQHLSPVSGLFWVRRLCPYFVFCLGIFLGAGGVMLLYAPAENAAQPGGLGVLGVALLLFWLANGLLERTALAWTLLHYGGATLVGGVGLALLRLSGPDIWLRLLGLHVELPGEEIFWFFAGLGLLGWATGLLLNRGTAYLLWHAATLPLALITAHWWLALPAGTPAASLSVAGWVLLTGLGLVQLVRQSARRAAHRAAPAKPAAAPLSRKYPTRFHELLARGRFCELFEVPCGGASCPLAITAASKYQQARQKYRLYPEMLEPFEKAYAMLVTPQYRDICRLAHEIMQMKEKQVGKKRYTEIEIQLWESLWRRLQEGEYRRHPPKDLPEKQRLLRDVSLELDV